MKAELKYLHSPDGELRSFSPTNPDDFCLYVQAMIGPKNGEGEESYGIEVCTPKWLERYCGQNGSLFIRHYIVINQYDYAQLYTKISETVSSIAGDSWAEIADTLSRMGQSEFEDYQEV